MPLTGPLNSKRDKITWTHKLQYFWALGVLMLVAPTISTACYDAPAHLSEPYRELVLTSESIVLAKAVSARDITTSGYATFLFEPIEVLKGDPPFRIALSGWNGGPYPAEELGIDGSDFESHTSPEFWALGLSNGVMNAACEVSGIFEVDQTYLLFFRDKSHFRAFENIRQDDDLWLAVVRLALDDLDDGGFSEDVPHVPHADSLSECIARIAADEKLRNLLHTAIDVCVERHGVE